MFLSKMCRSAYLQLCNIDTLCDTVPDIAQKHCPSLLSRAKEIQMKFKQVFILFKHCHDIYDGNVVTDAQIAQLGKDVNTSVTIVFTV